MTYLNFKNLKSIIQIINQGNIVALPTDTIFGLVGLVENDQVIDEIYKIKNRPIDKPLPIIVANWEQAQAIGSFSEELIEYLQASFLKGQVTVIVKKQASFNKNNYWKRWENIAIRVTNSKPLKEIINETGPLVATSCNISSQPPINDWKEINLSQLKYIVEGKITNGKASTIYDSINKKILRK